MPRKRMQELPPGTTPVLYDQYLAWKRAEAQDIKVSRDCMTHRDALPDGVKEGYNVFAAAYARMRVKAEAERKKVAKLQQSLGPEPVSAKPRRLRSGWEGAGRRC